MILDAYNTIYVWIGNHSNEFEKRGAFKSANTYIAQVRDGRDKEHTQVVEVEPGKESPNFTILFPDWIVSKAQKWILVEETKKQTPVETKKQASVANEGAPQTIAAKKEFP